MKKILFVSPDLAIGGSTTALLALLRQLDSQKIKSELLCLQNGSHRLDELPAQVKVLPDAAPYDLWTGSARLKKLWCAVRTGALIRTVAAVLGARKKPFRPYLATALNQMLAFVHARICPPVKDEYDVAVACLEHWPVHFTAAGVKAKQKIAWLHVDYEAARMNPRLDGKALACFDRIFCVSQANADRLRLVFPQLADRIGFSENPMDADMIRKKAEQPVEEPEFREFPGFRMVTVARLDAYTKGLDRLVKAAARLKGLGAAFRWYLIGGGSDEVSLKKQAAECGVEDVLFFLGEKENPYPYVKQADLFVLTSRNEGRPMTVTEAQLLGVPSLVTEYPAVSSQITDGLNGFVVENTDDAPIAETLLALCREPERLEQARRALNTETRQERENTLIRLLEQE